MSGAADDKRTNSLRRKIIFTFHPHRSGNCLADVSIFTVIGALVQEKVHTITARIV
jgi:hypothetical protein